MLKYGEVNPLAVFGLRQLDYCPPHFTSVDFDLRTSDLAITNWIWANLSGRFYSGNHYYRTPGGSIASCHRAAFEIPGEASMFGLMLDQINRPT